MSCQRSPCVGCCASTTAQTRWRQMEVVEVRERQSSTSRHGLGRRRRQVRARKRSAAQVCRGSESADYSQNALRNKVNKIRSTHHESRHLHATAAELWMLRFGGRARGWLDFYPRISGISHIGRVFNRTRGE